MNISKIDFHNFLYLFLTLIFCSMLTITSANSQENYKYRYKAEGVILHKNVQVPEESKDPCLTGDIGTVCETDGAIYVGEIGGVRRYISSSDINNKTWGLVSIDVPEITNLNEFSLWDNSTSGNENNGEYYTNILTPKHDYTDDGKRIGTAAMDCRNLGDEWYLPAYHELFLVEDYIIRSEQNSESNRYFDFYNRNYWSSTEHDRNRAMVIKFSPAPYDKINVRIMTSYKNISNIIINIVCFRKGLEE